MIVLIKKSCVIQLANFQVKKREARKMIVVEILGKFSFYYEYCTSFPVFSSTNLQHERARFHTTVV